MLIEYMNSKFMYQGKQHYLPNIISTYVSGVLESVATGETKKRCLILERGRFMRIMVFFDLPTITAADRREYNRFRKYLINSGYIMIQESVYAKLVTNYTMVKLEMEKLIKNRACNGLIQALTLTEKQYAGIIVNAFDFYVLRRSSHINL